MRLFVAINFDDETKKNIVSVQNKLKKAARGSFPRVENIHLTLVFLGEIDKLYIDKIKNCMRNITFQKMKLVFDNIGYFKQRYGNIYWMGLKKNENLTCLQKNLHNALTSSGFKLEKRTFKPHITIARRIKDYSLTANKELMDANFSTNVNYISLFSSEQKDGRRIYTEIFKIYANV